MNFDRRSFLKVTGALAVPALGFTPAALAHSQPEIPLPPEGPIINFFYDGDFFSTGTYLNELRKIHDTNPIKRDIYGQGGVVTDLEKAFAAITGKEKAIMMPTGTMANQLAIAVLSGSNTKVFVQDTSHVYRDEADAAQSVFNKRLMPLAPGKTFFTADELKAAIDNLGSQEVFSSGIGAVSIENPVRRSNGCFVPIEEIRKISEYCRQQKIKLHLDGARIYMAAAWTGVSVREYASYFDTIYISLYKYLNADGGAILCGDTAVIDQMPHHIKIHGGTTFSSWTNAAMALYSLNGIESRLQRAIERSNQVFTAINKMKGIRINPIPGGTNIYDATFDSLALAEQVQKKLANDFNIRIPIPKSTIVHLTVNETLLYQDADFIINAFATAVKEIKN